MVKFAIVFISLCFLILLFVLVNNSKNVITKIVLSNAFTTLVAGLIVLLGTFFNNPNFIDLAIIYVLLSFAVSAVLLYFITSDKNIKE